MILTSIISTFCLSNAKNVLRVIGTNYDPALNMPRSFCSFDTHSERLLPTAYHKISPFSSAILRKMPSHCPQP